MREPISCFPMRLASVGRVDSELTGPSAPRELFLHLSLVLSAATAEAQYRRISREPSCRGFGRVRAATRGFVSFPCAMSFPAPPWRKREGRSADLVSRQGLASATSHALPPANSDFKFATLGMRAFSSRIIASIMASWISGHFDSSLL